MPKSSSLTWPSAVDQHVRRLQVAVDDQVGVRVRDRRQHVEEQPDARRRRRAAARRSSDRCGGRRRARAPGRAGRRPRRRRRSAGRCADASSRARIVPSRRKRSSPARPTSAAFSSLTAAWPSKRPSLRRPARRCPCRPGRSARPACRRRGSDAGERGRRRAGRAAASRKPFARSVAGARRAAPRRRPPTSGSSARAARPAYAVALERRQVEHLVEMRLARSQRSGRSRSCSLVPADLHDRKRRATATSGAAMSIPQRAGAGKSAPFPSRAGRCARTRPASRQSRRTKTRRRT